MNIDFAMSSPLLFEDWGLIEYKTALERMLERVQQVSVTQSDGYLIFCSHPEVVTLGRATQSDDLQGWDGLTLEVSRGGRATYHGPSQIVLYPIINLKKSRKKRAAQDITAYLRDLENVIIKTLAHYGLKAEGRSLQKKNADSKAAEETGVWIEHKKIASLGIAVKNWVTYHGAAVNFAADTKAFRGLNPCGFKSDVMTNVETFLGKDQVSRLEFTNLLKEIALTDL